MTPSRVIGRANGQIPWHIPEDFRIFKSVTMGHIIVMGRKTFESIGKPLSGRTNVVLTRDEEFEADGVIVCHSVDEVLQMATNDQHIIICGGADIYEQFFPYMSHIHVSTVYEKIEHYNADILFPEYLDKFPEYVFKARYDKFEYGIFLKDKGVEIPNTVERFGPRPPVATAPVPVLALD